MSMAVFHPKFITFDGCGTLVNFQVAPVTHKLYADRLLPERTDVFIADFSAYCLDKVLSAFKPYRDVVANALIYALARSHGRSLAGSFCVSMYRARMAPSSILSGPAFRKCRTEPRENTQARPLRLGRPMHALFSQGLRLASAIPAQSSYIGKGSLLHDDRTCG
jgi:hypothetical protein